MIKLIIDATLLDRAMRAARCTRHEAVRELSFAHYFVSRAIDVAHIAIECGNQNLHRTAERYLAMAQRAAINAARYETFNLNLNYPGATP